MYELYCKLRDERKVRDSDVSKATGISKSTFSDWKSGRSTPKKDKIQRIANYFGVSVDYLMRGDDGAFEKPAYYLNDEAAAIAQEIFENKELRMLFDASRNATPEDLRTVREMMLALKRKERGGNE